MVVGNMCVYVHKYTEKQTSPFIFEPIFLKLFSWSQTSMHHCINLLDSLEAASLSKPQRDSTNLLVLKSLLLKQPGECISAKAEMNNDLAPRIDLKFRQH